jgi:hypothetical protein
MEGLKYFIIQKTARVKRTLCKNGLEHPQVADRGEIQREVALNIRNKQ